MQADAAYSAPVRPVQATTMSALEAAMVTATASHEPKANHSAPVTREQYQAARADLDARARAGKTIQGRNSKGQFLRGAKVSTFGAENVIPLRRTKAVQPGNMPAADVPLIERTAETYLIEAIYAVLSDDQRRKVGLALYHGSKACPGNLDLRIAQRHADRLSGIA